MKLFFKVFIIIISTSTIAKAGYITWQGGTDTKWGTASNWPGSVLPGAGDYVIIPTSFAVDVDAAVTVQGVRVYAGGTLNISSSFTCNNSLSPGLPGLYIFGEVNISGGGSLNISGIDGQPGIHVVGGVFSNTGTIDVNNIDKSGIKLSGGAVFTNNSSITIHSCSTTTGHGVEVASATDMFTNNSNITIGGSAGTIGGRGIFNQGSFVASSSSVMTISNSNDAALQNHGGTFTNAGVITLDKGNFNSKAIAASAVNPSFANSGTLNGVGAIQGKTGIFTNTGTIAPGFSPGSQAYVDGFNNSGTFEFELESTSDFDNLVFSGGSSSDFEVGGTIAVTLINGYSPVVNDEFKIVEAPNGYDGEFSTVDFTNSNATFWRTEYNANDITLRYAGVILPISLISFEAKPETNGVNLMWSTASEINNNGFQLYRSTDGETWDELAWITGQQEEGFEENDYEFMDKSPVSGINYYKLIQEDLDGTRSEFEVVQAEYAGRKVEFNIYPNPTFELINIVSENASSHSIKIYNSAGETVKSINDNSSQIDISNLPSGQYWIEMTSDAETSIKTIIKR